MDGGVGDLQRLQLPTAIGVRCRAHSLFAFRGQRSELLDQAPLIVEMALRAVAPHPALADLAVLRVLADIFQRDLMGAERPLDRLAIDLLRGRPSPWGCPEDGPPPPT